MAKLTGKIAVITGGNSGIGLASAKLFKAEGAQVIITARSAETFKLAQAEFGEDFDVFQADVSELPEIDRLVAHVKQKYGHIDVLFANAGIAEPALFEQVTEESFDRQYYVNVKGLFFTIQKALPLLNKGASIILNASVVASKGFPGMTAYSGTKAAIRNLARGLATELGPKGIRVNVLSPGPITTPIWDKMGLDDKAKAEQAERVTSTFPLGRMGRPEEMATVALFLASTDSGYMTGAELLADGGGGNV
jgi:NAD(P)-dependent dehydrogenase (short-subunit alcohol dehydrogenase family)